MLKLACVLLCLVHWASAIDIEFFSFSAPNEAFQPHRYAPNRLAAASKIQQQVIFIKNPETRPNNKVIFDNSAQHVAAQKTPIYSLNTQPNVSATKEKLQQAQQPKYNKPETKPAKYHGEPRNIQEKIAQGIDDDSRVRH